MQLIIGKCTLVISEQCVWLCVFMNSYMNACIYVCKYVHTYIPTYKHIHKYFDNIFFPITCFLGIVANSRMDDVPF